MANQEVVFPPDIGGIAAAAAMPASSGRALFACRGAASTSVRSGYRAAPAVDDHHYRARPPAAPCATSWVVDAIRASSPARSPAVGEYAEWTVSPPAFSVSRCMTRATVVVVCTK
jgi:trehalose 6-phosphate phosphatase